SSRRGCRSGVGGAGAPEVNGPNPGAKPRGVRLTRAVRAGEMRADVRLQAVMGVVPMVLSLAAPLAAQQQVSVRLDYERKEGASSCPDAGVVAASVSERLGYEPFDSAAPDTVKVTVFKKDRALQARIEMLGSDGKPKA